MDLDRETPLQRAKLKPSAHASSARASTKRIAWRGGCGELRSLSMYMYKPTIYAPLFLSLTSMSAVPALVLHPGTVVRVWWHHDSSWHTGMVKELHLRHGASNAHTHPCACPPSHLLAISAVALLMVGFGAFAAGEFLVDYDEALDGEGWVSTTQVWEVLSPANPNAPPPARHARADSSAALPLPPLPPPPPPPCGPSAAEDRQAAAIAECFETLVSGAHVERRRTHAGVGGASASAPGASIESAFEQMMERSCDSAQSRDLGEVEGVESLLQQWEGRLGQTASGKRKLESC